MRRCGLLVALLMLASGGDVLAADDAAGAWAGVTVAGPLGEAGSRGALNFAGDAQARYFDIGTGLNQWLVRASVGYRLRGGVELRAGYGRFRSRGRGGGVVNEDRPFQDLVFPLATAGGTLDVRARLEQRFVDVSSETAHVFRTRLRFRRPLGQAGSRFETHYEAFFALNDSDWAGTSRLAQWRIYLGVSRPAGPVRLEFGYLYQELDRDDRIDVGNHIVVLRAGYRFGSQ